MTAILALDQGTTSSRSIVYDIDGTVLGQAQQEFTQHFPQPGWVEHDPEEIWQTQRTTIDGALAAAGMVIDDIAAIGITNQRETVVLWDRKTGTPLTPAIVWQDRRTADVTDRLRAEGHEPTIRTTSGLVLDPYFSATKIAWLLDQDAGLRARADAGELAVGTIDCWLQWKLTNGTVHATDISNAARTSLMDIHTGTWSDELCTLFRVPPVILPKITSCAGQLATASALNDRPITAMIGDQQAALFGQACFDPGMAKCTYGTGAFAMVNTGSERPLRDGALTTVAWRIGEQATVYAIEGSVLVAGSAVQWLRDGLQIINNAAESEALARSVDSSDGVVVVPALAGLATPYWDAHARGTMLGVTRGTTRAHILRATLEGVAHSVVDAVTALADGVPAVLRVDGGMVANNLLLELQADRLGVAVERPRDCETTARGAAALAAVGAGLLDDPTAWWHSDHRVDPQWDSQRRRAARERWKRAITTTRLWAAATHVD